MSQFSIYLVKPIHVCTIRSFLVFGLAKTYVAMYVYMYTYMPFQWCGWVINSVMC